MADEEGHVDEGAASALLLGDEDVARLWIVDGAVDERVGRHADDLDRALDAVDGERLPDGRPIPEERQRRVLIDDRGWRGGGTVDRRQFTPRRRTQTERA